MAGASLALAMLTGGGTARGAERYWVTSAGGVFGTNTNWASSPGGAGGVTVPGVNDTANLTLNPTYTITFGANATTLGLGVQSGNTTFDLQGKTYTQTGASNVLIGNTANSTGRLTVVNGTMAVDTVGDDVVVGSAPGGTGFLTISTGAKYIGEMELVVGNLGTGTLTLQNGGDVVSASNIIGLGGAGVGTATVTGIGSTWTVNGFQFVGDAATGTLEVLQGGVVSASNVATIGDDVTSIGQATVSGAGSQWNLAQGLVVANAGAGSLNVGSGGFVTATTVNVGSVAGSVGLTSVSGVDARLNATGLLTLGSAGYGALTVAGGGTVTSAGGTLGGAATGVGNVVVTGAGSQWNSTAAINVGASGTGSLTVADGGTVSTTGTLLLNDAAGDAIGSMTIDGGTVIAGGFQRNGAATLNHYDGLFILTSSGYGNGGDLTVNGRSAGDLPIVRLAGSATNATQIVNLNVGSTNAGAFEIVGNSSLATQSVSIGTTSSGDGEVTVWGNGASLTTTVGAINVGGTNSAGGGHGTLNIGAGASVSTVAGGALRLWAGGEVNIDGGTLTFGSLASNGGVMHFNSGRVVQNSLVADATTLTTILGPEHELGIGRTLSGGTGAATLSTMIDVNGGRLEGSTVAVNAGALAQVRSSGVIAATTTLTNSGEIYLSSPTASLGGTSLANSGLVSGTGRVEASLANAAAGQVRVGFGERMVFTAATNSNDGLIDVVGGEVEFQKALSNNTLNPSRGAISARDATLRFTGGLTNSGSLTIAAGINDVYGDINNVTSPTGGRIVVSGGAQAIFHDDITNPGTIQVSGSGTLKSTAVFLGSLSGNGVAGTGSVFIEGDARPGFSPGTMSFGGDVSFGPLSSLNIELAGTTPGTQYDRVVVADEAALGGTLNVSLLGGFTPAIGQTFTIMTFGSATGQFDALNFAVSGTTPGLGFTVSYTPTSVILTTTGLLPGDINLDGRVNVADAAAFAKVFGTASGATWATGDFNGDGKATIADMMILQNHLGAVSPVPSPAAVGASAGAPGAGPAAVPEPGTMALAGAGLALLAAARRRRGA